jgi:hypothetical protein
VWHTPLFIGFWANSRTSLNRFNKDSSEFIDTLFDFEWIHQPHWTDLTKIQVNLLIHWTRTSELHPHLCNTWYKHVMHPHFYWWSKNNRILVISFIESNHNSVNYPPTTPTTPTIPNPSTKLWQVSCKNQKKNKKTKKIFCERILSRDLMST